MQLKKTEVIKSKTNNTQQAFWIALSGLFSFGFGIVSSMILSRYFSKGDYGTYKQVIYVYSTLLAVFTLGLPKAFSYFLPRVDEDQAKSLIKKVTNLFFLLGGVFSVLLFFASDYIADYLNNPDLAYALKIFSPVPLLMLPTMGLEGILSTFRMTKFMAVYTIATRTGMLLFVALPVMLFGGNYIQALIGFTIASFISFILALYFKYYPVKQKGNIPVNIKYREIFRFSLPLLTASLWGILLKSSDQFFISRYFGAENFAEFSNGAIDLPFMGMIVGATATVLSPIFSRMSHEKLDPKIEIFPLWKSVFEKSAMLVYPLLVFSIVYAEMLMVILYGEQYKNSAIYYQIYNISNLFQIIVYAPLIINIGAVKFYRNVHMYSALLLIPLEYLAIKLFNTPVAVIKISVSLSVLRSLILLSFVSKYFKVSFIQLFPIRLIGKIVIPSVVLLLLIKYLFAILPEFNIVATLFFSMLTYLVTFGVYSKLVNLDYLEIITPLFNKLRK